MIFFLPEKSYEIQKLYYLRKTYIFKIFIKNYIFKKPLTSSSCYVVDFS